MNRYKVINLKTNEEHLCDKVTIDGFDYYVSKQFIEEGDFAINLNIKEIKQYDGIKGLDSYWKKVIVTNNPSINIPKVVNEVEKLANQWSTGIIQPSVKTAFYISFKEGYNKSQEKYSFSEKDMIEFSEWKFKNLFFVVQDLSNGIQWKSNNKLYNKIYKTKELIQLWKEQQIKTIYYE